ncbi:unnamed protein product [Tetraodon nigroviridis]|uniref:Chromosome undetermined SCAF3438, whole genome shotgun sequence n=1 Tax=Tetraodon nigroviridis TaxID=99883 RepID=Q4TGW2_TETNG|nr:unnamed protein product [Tetraodon nigroviridis]
MAKRLGKRKIDSECRTFNLQWTNDYFVESKEKPAKPKLGQRPGQGPC